MTQQNLIGTTLGRFEIISELGRGGMAVVYKAHQADLDRIVALKILPPDLTHDTSYIARFRQEARSVARLEHPHIMPIYDVGETNGIHYIAMKFIQGRTLKEVLQEEGAMPVRRAAEILAQVGDALDYAHRQGVIHRDIKPSNVMLTDEGWAYLTDFGLARGTGNVTSGLTMAGTVMGTPEYMSPEQAQGLPTVGPPTDIYALGVVLYELLTGTFPFHAETPMAMLAARLLQAPIPPRDVRGDLPSAVEDVVMRALARKPEARFASSAEMVAALRSAAGIGAGTSAQPPLTPGAGMPAIGETIVTNTGGSPTPPYVRPQTPTPPPRDQVGAAIPPLPHLSTPPPTIPVGANNPPPVAAAPTKPKTGLFIGIGAAVVVILMLIGGAAIALRPKAPVSPTSIPTNAAIATLLTQSEADLVAGELDAALAGYQQALDEAPGNLAALQGIAIIDNLRADWQQAEISANELVNAASSDDQAAALGLTLLADAIISQGSADEAEDTIEEALNLDTSLALAHAIRSTITASQAADLNDTNLMDTALAEADTAIDELDSENSIIQALTYNAIAVTFSEDYSLTDNSVSLSSSEENYQQAIDLLPNVALFHTNMGYLYNNSADYEQARSAFETALDIDPNYSEAQLGIGWGYYRQDQGTKADEAFDTALSMNPNNPNTHYAKGRIAFDNDEYRNAINYFERANQLNPRSTYTLAWLARAYQFEGFFADNDATRKDLYAKAESIYRQALDIRPNFAFATSGLGWVLQYQEKYEESISIFERAIELNPNDDEAYNGLGWSLFNLDRLGDAETAFRQSTQLAPNYASPQYGLGRTLEELGRLDEARAAFKTTLEIDPTYTQAEEALKRLGN
ncbi:serine/threonine protein kinase with TPR repeats [Oscillochloris trichoides DG-6]|uniref:non-specific serine/threonine protein kinase n=1 Tax=Oscillochloris trichoides DG-6 TaxID=765420 RepID=E1IE23_9CHLR|nr:tetratricopeptide repeat protein [Oscillochloris trichoides]EFO80565.1 serine/threonine protein kinase with TPR repeats [Oscillochloris trichoides DG-6]